MRPSAPVQSPRKIITSRQTSNLWAGVSKLSKNRSHSNRSQRLKYKRHSWMLLTIFKSRCQMTMHCIKVKYSSRSISMPEKKPIWWWKRAFKDFSRNVTLKGIFPRTPLFSQVWSSKTISAASKLEASLNKFSNPKLQEMKKIMTSSQQLSISEKVRIQALRWTASKMPLRLIGPSLSKTFKWWPRVKHSF